MPGVAASTVEEWTHISVGNVPDSLFAPPGAAMPTMAIPGMLPRTIAPTVGAAKATPTVAPKTIAAASPTATKSQAAATVAKPTPTSAAGAARWQAVKSGTEETLTSVSIASAKEAWAVGAAGVMLHYLDGAWQAVEPLLGERLDAVTVYPGDARGLGRGRRGQHALL